MIIDPYTCLLWFTPPTVQLITNLRALLFVFTQLAPPAVCSAHSGTCFSFCVELRSHGPFSQPPCRRVVVINHVNYGPAPLRWAEDPLFCTRARRNACGTPNGMLLIVFSYTCIYLACRRGCCVKSHLRFSFHFLPTRT